LSVEIGGGEGAHACLADGDVLRLRAETGVDLATGASARRSGPAMRAITLQGGVPSKSAVSTATRTQATCPPWARTSATALLTRVSSAPASATRSTRPT
jgi:hypothetical protein